jgi:hypothetical protein
MNCLLSLDALRDEDRCTPVWRVCSSASPHGDLPGVTSAKTLVDQAHRLMAICLASRRQKLLLMQVKQSRTDANESVARSICELLLSLPL